MTWMSLSRLGTLVIKIMDSDTLVMRIGASEILRIQVRRKVVDTSLTRCSTLGKEIFVKIICKGNDDFLCLTLGLDFFLRFDKGSMSWYIGDF